ncbi:hypothetical protein Q8F55_002611 [Vanrija albida]|uniref:ribonuclease H n=1 Tax=Vanrija albida TaxID=181172 RepID=A0ABR3QAW6_9TREE
MLASPRTLRRLTLPTRHLSPAQRTLLSGLRIYVGLRPSRRDTEDSDMPKAAFYAVAAGRTPGIYPTWGEAEAQVKGFTGARFKKFPSEAAARAFVRGEAAPAAAPYARSGKSDGASAGGRGDGARTSAGGRDSPPRDAPDGSLPPELQALAAKGFTLSRGPPHRLVAYTDGSALGNGKKRARAGLGVFWGGVGEAYKANLAERVPGEPQTNNRGELLSIIRALETCPYPLVPLEIRTDSQYSINCITKFLPGWLKNGWKTSTGEVKNAEMIKHLLVLLRARSPTAPVKFKYVRGHAGHAGNEAADRLARMGAAAADVAERTDWLDPDDARAEAGAKAKAKPPSDVEVEIDPEWLMTDEEMLRLERALADE